MSRGFAQNRKKKQTFQGLQKLETVSVFENWTLVVNSKGIPPPTNAGRFRFRNYSIFFGGSSNGTWKSILPETNIAVDCFEGFLFRRLCLCW